MKSKEKLSLHTPLFAVFSCVLEESKSGSLNCVSFLAISTCSGSCWGKSGPLTFGF